MLLTTTPTIEGHPIKQYLGIVTGETIIGTVNITDFSARLHRMAIYYLRGSIFEGKKTALKELQQRAAAMGANAVVGIDLDYETVGTNRGMLMVTASGTAVQV